MERVATKASEVIVEAGAKWGVTVDWWESNGLGDDATKRMMRNALPDDLNSGPAGACHSMKGKLVWAVDDEPHDVFHELMHVVCGQPSLVIDEGYLLLPFEWHMAKILARQMGFGAPEFMGSAFLGGVREYQRGTSIAEIFDPEQPGIPEVVEVGGLVRCRSTMWWANGLRRAQRLGMLDRRLQPTWRCAEWKGSGVVATKRWTIDTDRRYACGTSTKPRRAS